MLYKRWLRKQKAADEASEAEHQCEHFTRAPPQGRPEVRAADDGGDGNPQGGERDAMPDGSD